MGAFFGWILIATAVYLLVSAFRRPAAPAPAAAAGETGRGPYLWGGVAALVVGLLLAVWPLLASVRMEAAELSRKDNWAFSGVPTPDAPLHWNGNTLVADL